MMRSIVVSGIGIVCLVLASCHNSKDKGTAKLSAADAALKKKYSTQLGVEEHAISNLKLYRFIDEWYGVPYKYGGKTKTGVDCSGFTSALLRDVYGIALSGSAQSMYEGTDHVAEKNLKEGDLVFFKINSKSVSHVGVYLQNRRFVHASTKRGITINNLDEAYYKKYFFKGGRPKSSTIGQKK
jgi:murein DD-endopeptidase / murein LD-carboxypeptidase